MPDPATAQKILKIRRGEILGDLTTIEDALDDPVPKDWDDAASERQGDEVLQALGEHDLAELAQIEAALERIEKGTYGTCMTCGGEIGVARLMSLPATPFCKDCANAQA